MVALGGSGARGRPSARPHGESLRSITTILLWLCDRSSFVTWFPETPHLLAIGRPLGAVAEPAFQLSRIASRFPGLSMVCAGCDARRSGGFSPSI